jgi:hypothetical protein
MAIYYVTYYIETTKGQKKSRTYTTKSLTPFHESIRSRYPGSRTVKCDTSIKWPFGVFAEVVAESK